MSTDMKFNIKRDGMGVYIVKAVIANVHELNFYCTYEDLVEIKKEIETWVHT